MNKPTDNQPDANELAKRLSEVSAKLKSTQQESIADVRTLVQFINRLGNAVRGVDTELDQKLAQVRSLTSKQTVLTKILPVMDDISVLLQQQGARIQRQLHETQENVQAAARRLQKSTQLPGEAKAQLRELIQQSEGPAYSILQYFPYLNQLLKLYQRNLDLLSAEQQRTTTPSDGNGENSERIAQLQSELANLLSVVDFAGVATNALQTIRQRLMTDLSCEQLMLVCIETLQLIIRGINDERQAAQLFLHSLNDALQSVSKVVARSLQTSNESNEAQQVCNEKLQQRVDALSDSVNQAKTFEQLKTDIRGHMQAIAATLSEKQALEAEDHKRLKKQLLSMQARLEDVENEAQMYKRKLNEQKFKSLQDSLTRLPNRAAFEERLELEFQRFQGYGTPLVIAIADIDHFKVINDTYGHIAGDKTLQVIANMLKKSLRGTDFVCRYGGEEFVILFPQTDIEYAVELLEKARHRIKSIPFKFKNEDISITISMGAAHFTTDDTTVSVFERADRALYQAKEKGRDRVVLDSR